MHPSSESIVGALVTIVNKELPDHFVTDITLPHCIRPDQFLASVLYSEQS